MKLVIVMGATIILIACNSITRKEADAAKSVVGSWYTDLQDGGGAFDTIRNYAEIYVNDTSLYFQEELMGQSTYQSYFIRNDTIFKCFWMGENCEFIPMYQIDSFKNDTLWMTVNQEYSKRGPTVYWVKLPEGEFGHYDHVWTKANSDSLGWAVVYDYDRRKWKYYSLLANKMNQFDSLLKAGTWKWSMKDQDIQDALERRRKRGQ